MNELEFVKEMLLKKPKHEKIELLKEAISTDFALFFSMAQIYLDAPLGEGGGLTTEEVDQIVKERYP